MRKILLTLIVILLCGCNNANIDNDIDNNKDNLVENLTKDELLAQEMKKEYSQERYSVIEENIGKSYFTSLIATNSYLVDETVFNGCNAETSGYSIFIYDKNGELAVSYKVILDCDGKTTTYYHKDLSLDSKPTNITERVNENGSLSNSVDETKN